MKALAVVVMVGALGCGDNLVDSSSQLEQSVGADNCSTMVSASSSGATVTVTVDEGFNAWQSGNAPSVTLTGSSETCTGTVDFTAAAAGTWSFTPGNEQCSTYYSGDADLGIAANHWHYLNRCDGSVQAVGCQGEVSYTAAVLIDGPGQNDYSTVVSGTIGAVHDPDEDEVCDACPIGACVSACEAACPQGDTDCGQCCECWCKDEQREEGNASCEPQDLCYSGSEGHAVCLLAQPL
jgi:hypothetical protein